MLQRGCPRFPAGRIIATQVGGLAMHKISISQSVIDRVVARRGREHIFDDLDPAKTALVVVDMQNGFMLPGVAHSPCLMAQEIVPNINRLAAAGRAKRKRSLSVGGKGYELWPDLKVDKADLIVEKNRYSAFIQGSSDLADV